MSKKRVVKSIESHHNGGITSISQDPIIWEIHDRIAPSAIHSSSKAVGMGSKPVTFPDNKRIMQVPHVPDVQFVGITTPAVSASSAKGTSDWTIACPSKLMPRKNRTTDGWVMISPQRLGLFRVQRPVCLLKNKPAFFIHLLNFVAPAPVRRMKSSRSSCAWM